MTDTNKVHSGGALKAGLIGTALGAAAGAAAVALSDKKTRDKAIKQARDFKKRPISMLIECRSRLRNTWPKENVSLIKLEKTSMRR